MTPPATTSYFRNLTACLALALAGMLSLNLNAADYQVQVLEEPAPADELSEEVAAELSPSGFRVVRGSTRTVCEIWPCKEWAVKADFTPSSELLYPFQPGQLIGVLRFRRPAAVRILVCRRRVRWFDHGNHFHVE